MKQGNAVRAAGWAAGALLLGLLSGPARAKTLVVGDPAPPLAARFVKGQPVTSFQKNQVYVVEFWATWCGPCKATVPHITEMQRRYPAVTFIGVSLWEDNPAGVVPYVQQMGNQMDYRVAMDVVAPGHKREDGPMSMNWMEANRQSAIPRAFVVDRASRVAWVGPPPALEAVLKQVLAGKWDLHAETVKDRQRVHTETEMQAVGEMMEPVQNNPAAVAQVLAKAIHKYPDLQSSLSGIEFEALVRAGKHGEAATLGQHIIGAFFNDNPKALTRMAQTVVSENTKSPSPALLAVALRAAQRADGLVHQKVAVVADTLARALYLTHQPAKAMDAENRAIQNVDGADLEGLSAMRKRFSDYRRAAGK